MNLIVSYMTAQSSYLCVLDQIQNHALSLLNV